MYYEKTYVFNDFGSSKLASSNTGFETGFLGFSNIPDFTSCIMAFTSKICVTFCTGALFTRLVVIGKAEDLLLLFKDSFNGMLP